MSGTGSLLASVGTSAFLSLRGSRADGNREPVATWVMCERFRVATEVTQILAGRRFITVQEHGYLIVSWRSRTAYTSTGRPPIWRLDENGAILTHLAPGAYLDSAVMAAAES